MPQPKNRHNRSAGWRNSDMIKKYAVAAQRSARFYPRREPSGRRPGSIEKRMKALEAEMAKLRKEAKEAKAAAAAKIQRRQPFAQRRRHAPPPVFVSFKNGLFVETEDKLTASRLAAASWWTAAASPSR